MRKFRISRLGISLFLILLLWIAFAAVGHASSADAVWPENDGEVVQNDGKLIIDASHADEGYVMACISAPSDHRMKMRVAFNGAQLTYDLNSSGDYEVFPLQLGSGSYEFSLFENVTGTKYSSEGKVDITVQLVSENAAFLCPNQYVNYTLLSGAVAKSDELGENASQSELYNSVCNFMASEFAYDFVRAASISPGELPELDACYDSRLGICQDLSAVMVCMLRVQGIPARLMIGYADKYYHAWTTAVVDGQEVFFDPTAAINALDAKTYTVERYY